MSGDLFEVLGNSRFSPGNLCPSDFRGKSVKLLSTDGKEFDVAAEAAFISNKIRSTFIDQGSAFVYPMPFAKQTVTKLVEYFKYHKDHPFSEMTGSVESKSLADLGASRWDESWIKVDHNLLFEIMLGASVLDIPSLIWLTGAKVAMMIKGKSPDRLRKEFGMMNDFPPGEEKQVLEAFSEIKGIERGTQEELSLWGSALIMSGMSAAAEKLGIHAPSRSQSPAPPSINLRSWRLLNWRILVMQDWTKLALAPSQTRADRDLLFAAVQFSSGAALEYASDDLKGDRALVLEACGFSGRSLRHAAAELRGDRDFVLQAIKANAESLLGASDALRGDREIVLRAAEIGQGSAFQGASPALRADRDLALQCIELDPKSLQYVADELMSDRSFALEAVRLQGLALKFLPVRFKADREIVAVATAADAGAAVFAHSSRRSELGIAMPWDAASSARPGAGLGEDFGVAPAAANSTGSRHVALVQDAGRDRWHWTTKLNKAVYFSAMSTAMGNMGQANYVAANIFLDKIAGVQRPELDSVTLMWGAVGNIGMRWKAFASADLLIQTPDALLTISDASQVLRITCCRMETPEHYGASHFDEYTRSALLYEGDSGRKGGWVPGEQLYVERRGHSMKPRWLGSKPRTTGSGRGWQQRQQLRARWPPHAPVERDREQDAESVEDEEDDERQIGHPGREPDGEGQRSAPLGGWPKLSLTSDEEAASTESRSRECSEDERQAQGHTTGEYSDELAADEEPLLPSLIEGCRVELVNLRSKNGWQGTLLRQTADGKWKVNLDGGLGIALLKDAYIRPLPME